ncbi:MAG: hypothetical protein K2R93_10985 [Gemmatimonadaceae bacterium]|nr:hypothetical protein [Gemmatimonadaceae bacterium]
MITLSEATARFRALATAGDIINRKTGAKGPFAASRIAPILSNVTAAVRYAAYRIHGREFSDAELQQVDLEPLWSALPQFAYEGAQAPGNERSDPAKERANVRLFVSAVTGRDIERTPQPVCENRVPEDWRQLYEAIVQAEANEQIKHGTAKGYRRGILRLAQLALLHGVTRPEDLPAEAVHIYQWGVQSGWRRKEIDLALSSYRRAAELIGANHLPRAYELVRRDGLGIKSLPDYPERLLAAGYVGDPRTITTLDAIKLLAPLLGTSLERVLDGAQHRGLSPGWVSARVDMASWVVATLIRERADIPAELTTLKWMDLWLQTRPTEVRSDDERRAQLADYLGSDSAGDLTLEHRSLMRLLLEASAARSYANSPLTLANPAHERDVVPVYTEKLQAHLESAWMVTYAFFGDVIQKKKPELWARVRNEYEAIVRHIGEYNRPRALTGRKNKASLPISWPQMMCMGLPFLMQEAYEARRAINERLYRVGNVDSRDSGRLVAKYCEALRRWMVTLILTDDGLRIKNYAGAMLGEQIIPTWERDKDGRICGLLKLSTRWSGLDPQSVRLKVTSKAKETNERRRDITPAFLDPILAFDYLTLARPRALADAGLLNSVEDYKPDTDCWSFFVTPRPRAAQVSKYVAQQNLNESALVMAAEPASFSKPAPPDWRGNFSEDMLSNIYGEAMHRVCTKVLKRDLPTYDSPDLTDRYRSIFSAHITRTEIACYWGGIRQDWTTAMWLTNDEEHTLRKHYHQLQAAFERHRNARSCENPRWFDAVVDRALGNYPEDDWMAFWRSFDPHHPDACLQRMLEKTESRRPTNRMKKGKASP